MPDNNNQQKITKIPTIPFDVKIDITVGGGLYARLSQLMTHYASQKTEEEFSTILAFLQQPGNKPRDEFEYHVITLLSLVVEIEIKAKEQGKIIETEMPQA